jgi:hypothetical protein
LAVAHHCRHHHAGDVRRSGSNIHPVEQFSHSESQAAASQMLAKNLVSGGKEMITKYLIVVGTAAMVALYALIALRLLPKT